MDNQSPVASGSTGPNRTTPEKSNPRLPLPEGANETITAHQLRMNPVRQLGLGGVNVPPPQTCRKIFDKRYYLQQINNHMIIIDKEINRLYDQLMHHKLQSTNHDFVENKVFELSKQFAEKEEYLKILNDVVRLHDLHKGKPIDVSKNITMLRKANKERMESMEKIQFFDRKDLERVAEKLRFELEQEDRLKKEIINALSIADKEELEELIFLKDEMAIEKETMETELETLRSDIERFEAKMSKEPKMEIKYKLRALINEAPEIAEKYNKENKDFESFEKQGKIIRMEIETLGILIEKLEDDMNTDYTDQNRRLAKFREFQRREKIIENFLENYSTIARDTFDKLSDLQNKIVYSLEYLSATDEEKDPLWDPEEYEYYVNPNLQKEAVIEIIVKLQKQYVWFRHTLDQFRMEINELLKLKRTYTDEIEIYTNYEDIRDEMIDRQNELATLKTSLTRSLESTSAAIVEADGNKQTVEKKIQHNPAYLLFQELQAKLARVEEKNQKLKDAIDKVVFGAEVGPIKKECLKDMEELKADILEKTEDNSSFLDVVNRHIAEAKIAKEINEPYPINQIRFFKCGALDPSVSRVEPVKKATPSSNKTTPAENKSGSKETPKKLEKHHYYSDDDSSPESSSTTSTNDNSETSQQTPTVEVVVDKKERLSSIRKNLREEFSTAEKKDDEKKKSNIVQEHLSSVKKVLSKEFEMITPENSSGDNVSQAIQAVTTTEAPTAKQQQKPTDAPYDNQELYSSNTSPQGSKVSKELVFTKDSRIKTTVCKDKPQTKQLYRRFSAYGVNIRDQTPDNEDFEDNSEEQHTEEIETLPVIVSPDILKIAVCLSPVREESEKPDETDSETDGSAEVQEEIEPDEHTEQVKSSSEESDSDVIKIEFHQPNDDQPAEESEKDTQQFDPNKDKLEYSDKPAGESPKETVDDPNKISYKGFTICVKEAQDCDIKSPGSARSSAIDDIVTEFALHSKENSQSEESDDSKHTTPESAEQSETEFKKHQTLLKKEVTSSGSASSADSKTTYLMDEHISLIKDEMKEEFGEVKIKKRFTHIVKFADQKSDDEESLEPEITKVVEEEAEEEEDEEVAETYKKDETETSSSSEISPYDARSKTESPQAESSDLQETPPTSPVSQAAMKAPSSISGLDKTPSTSPDLEQTPPLSPTSEKPPITTPEMDTSATTSPELNRSPMKTPTTTPALMNSPENSEDSSDLDEEQSEN